MLTNEVFRILVLFFLFYFFILSILKISKKEKKVLIKKEALEREVKTALEFGEKNNWQISFFQVFQNKDGGYSFYVEYMGEDRLFPIATYDGNFLKEDYL